MHAPHTHTREDWLAQMTNVVDNSLPGISIDCVILGYQHQVLKVLLLKWKDINRWSLPGGFIMKDEDMDEAAQRILFERTGLDSVFLSQFRLFGDQDRRKSEDLEQMNRLMVGFPEGLKHWLRQRFITCGYFAFADIDQSLVAPDGLSDECQWVDINALPSLIFDHQDIISHCLSHIQKQMNYLPFGKSLLPEKFTMNDLQLLYEAILRRKLDRANFQKKMLKLEIFERCEKKYSGKAHKAPYLYRFKSDAYNHLLTQGIGFI